MKSESKIAMGGGAKASKKLMAAMAVLAVAFVVLAAVPVALTDSDATRAAATSSSENATSVAAGGAITATSGSFYVNAAAKIDITTSMEPASLKVYLGPSAELSVYTANSGSTTAAKGFMIYQATGYDASTTKATYYADSEAKILGNASAVVEANAQKLTIADGGYKFESGDIPAPTTTKNYVKATYSDSTVLWTNGMASVKQNWSISIIATAQKTSTVAGQVIMGVPTSTADNDQYTLTITDGTTSATFSGGLKTETAAGTLTVATAKTASAAGDYSITSGNNYDLTGGLITRNSGTLNLTGMDATSYPYMANGIASNGTVGSAVSGVIDSSGIDVYVLQDTTLADAVPIYKTGITEAVSLGKGLKTTDLLKLAITSGYAMTITSAEKWTGASIEVVGTIKSVALGAANGSISIGSYAPSSAVAVTGSSSVIYGTLTINKQPSPSGNLNTLALTSSVIAESGYVELKDTVVLTVTTKLDVLGTISGSGSMAAASSWSTDEVYTQDATMSNITISGTKPDIRLDQVAYKVLGSSDNNTAGIDFAAKQGFKEIRLYANEGGDSKLTIGQTYSFPEGVTVKQSTHASNDYTIEITGSEDAKTEVTVPSSTTLVLDKQKTNGSAVTLDAYSTLILEGKIKGAYTGNTVAVISGNGTFNMASTGAVESGKVSVQTKYATGTVAEIQVVGNMDTVPYPLYQKVIIPEGQTATVGMLSTVTIYGQLEVKGTLVIEDEATLVLGMSGTVQSATIAVGSEGSIEIKNGGTVLVQNATITADGDISVEGTLQLASPSTLTVKSLMTESSTGIIGMTGNAYIAVGTDGVLTLGGYLGVGTTYTDVAIKNSGSVIIDNASIAIRATNPQGSATVSLVADAASVDIESFLVEKNDAKITVNDVGLQLAKVDSKYYYVAESDTAADGAKNYVVQYNKVELGSASADAKITGPIVISEKLTSKVSSNKLKVSNVMEISGSITNTSTIVSPAVTPTQTVTTTMTSSSSSVSVTSGITTYSGLSFTANLSVPSDDTLAIGQWVSVTNSGVLKVAGYIDMTATGVSNLTNSGSISVTGKVKISAATGDISGGTVNAAKYVTKEGESSILYNNYTSFDQAVEGILDGSNKNTDKTITISGIIDVSESVTVGSPVKIKFASSSYASNKLTVGSSDSSAVLIFEEGAKLTSNKNQVVVDGTLYFADKDDDSTTKTIADVTIESDSTEDITYTNIYTALENASSGDVVEVTKADKDADGSADYVKLTKSVAIGDGVTLKIGSSAAGLKLSNGVTLTVNGVLDTAKDITAEKAFAKTASLKSGEERSAIALNGTIKAGAGANVYAPSSGTSAALSTGAYVSGAYYTMDSVQTISTLEIAEDNFAKIASTSMTVYGTVTAGDLSFAKTSSTTCSEIILAAGASSTSKNSMTVSSITLSGVKITVQQNTSLTGEIEDASGAVTVSKIAGASTALVIADVSGNLTLTGEAVASDESIFTVSSGTVYAGTTGTSGVAFLYDAESDANAMGVASGATLMGENVNDIDKIVVDGTFAVEKSKNATVVSMTVYGTVDVFEGSDTESKGTLTVSTELYIGTDDETVTGAAAVFNGPITYGTSAFVVIAADASVDADAIKSFGKIKTEFYVQDSLWITVYKTENSTLKISAFDNPTPKDAYFSGWLDTKGVAVQSTSPSRDAKIGDTDCDKVYASVTTQIYQIIIKADQGIGDLYLNGNIMQKGTITTSGYQYYAYWATVEAGTYEVTCKLANGYSGTAVLKDADGKDLAGNKLTVSGNEYNQSLITSNYQLTGIEKSGYVDPVEPEKKDNSLTVTDYLLIVLVILVVVLAVIVAMRLMRS